MDETQIYAHLSKFAKCDGCSSVFPSDPDGKYVFTETPAPCCGAKGPRGIWPEPAIALYIETARQQPANEEGLRVQGIMLAAGAEVVMQQSVWAALERRIGSPEVAMAFMKRCRTLDPLKNAFKDLTGRAVGTVLKDEGFARFWSTWGDIVEFRNGVAHGAWHQRALDRERLVEFAEQLIPAAAAIWNCAVK